MRILVAEDAPAVAGFLRCTLEDERHVVDVAGDGEQAAFLALENNYDLLILDLNLPRRDGLDVLREVRAGKEHVPVLILTARERIEERVEALDLGADDYLTKPFDISELSARVRALLRRGARQASSVLRVEDLELDRVERRVRRGPRAIELTPKEFALLEYLMLHGGRSVTRAMIARHIWDLPFDPVSNVLEVYINYLRKKVDAESDRKLIHTVRGVGYQIGVSENMERASGSRGPARPVSSTGSS